MFHTINYQVDYDTMGYGSGRLHHNILYTAPNTATSPNFLVYKFCGNTQVSQSFGQYAESSVKTVRIHKIPTTGN